MAMWATQMPWHDGGMHWGWGGFWILVALVLAVLLWGGMRSRSGGRRSGGVGRDAEEELRSRFARGEIDEEEFARRLEVLRSRDQGA